MGLIMVNGFYFPNGGDETKGKFKNGVRIGKWKYYESGALKQVSSYSRTGQRSGKWIEYKENGDIIKLIIININLQS